MQAVYLGLLSILLAVTTGCNNFGEGRSILNDKFDPLPKQQLLVSTPDSRTATFPALPVLLTNASPKPIAAIIQDCNVTVVRTVATPGGEPVFAVTISADGSSAGWKTFGAGIKFEVRLLNEAGGLIQQWRTGLGMSIECLTTPTRFTDRFLFSEDVLTPAAFVEVDINQISWGKCP
jgi:hypothetical protein